MNVAELKTLEDVEAWLTAKFDRSGRRKKVLIERLTDDDKPRVRARIWTTQHLYSIVAVPGPISEHAHFNEEGKRDSDAGPSRKLAGYLGCVVRNRAARPGEEQFRGNDLADGSLDDDTFRRIIADIVFYESLEIATPSPAVSIPLVGECKG